MSHGIGAINMTAQRQGMTKKLGCGLIGFGFLLLSFQGHAALGGNRESVVTDHKALGTQNIVVSQESLYQVHELQHPSGATVREYVSPQGKVFAVNWEGNVAPNLQQILGQHYPVFLKAISTPHSGHHMVQVKEGNLVVTHIQYLRQFSGSAFDTSLVPAGVDATQLK